MSHVAITLAVLGGAVALFIRNQLPAGVVAIGVAMTLYVTGVVTVDQSLAGFGDPVIVYIAALFVVSEALDATGVSSWAGARVIRWAGTDRRSLLVAIIALVALLTALISVNGAVAALVPMTAVLALRSSVAPSQLMMPLAFGAHAGSLLALTGSPVNVLVSEIAVDAGQQPFGFFEFALVGLPLVIGTVLICVFAGRKLLPHRTPAAASRDLSEHARVLTEQYSLPGPGAVVDRQSGLIEVVVPPRSDFIGDVAYPGMVTESGQLVIVAIHRSGDEMGKVELAVGDVLLLQGTWAALDAGSTDPNVIVVDAPQAIRRQAVPLGPGAKKALCVVAVMVVLLVLGTAPAVAALVAAGAMIVLKVITLPQAHRSIAISTLVLVGGMIPLSTAIQTSGTADLIAGGLVDALGDAGPRMLLFGIVVVVAVLGQLISNMATVLIVAPIAVAVAAEVHISPVPLLMAVAVAGAAALLTPVATASNVMVMDPGGYRFGDYWKLGLPLLAMYLAVAVFVVPIFWPF